MTEHKCFFADRVEAGSCDGQLIRAHLLPRQLLKREFRHGCVLEAGRWWPLKRGEDRYQLEYRSLTDLINDERCWVACCGGPMGNAGHHGQMDGYQLRIARDELPVSFVEFCEELGLGWFIERTYA